MNKRQINNLVVMYKNGDETALVRLFSALNPIIEKASREVEPYIEDFTKFDCRVVTELKRLVDTFDKDRHDFLSGAKAVISQSKARYIRRNSRKRNNDVMLSALSPNYSIGDPRENTEQNVLFKEKVALLAQGNPRKETTLLQWSKGADDKSISELLAQLHGGKAESHRKFIQRFKTECRNRLEN